MDRLRTYSLPVSCESSDPGVKRVQLYPLADLHRPVNGNGCTASGDRREVQNRDRPATLRHRAYEPRALSSIVTRTEAKPDALVDVLPFPPGPPHFHLGPRSSRDRYYIALNTRGSSEKRSKKAKIKVAENGLKIKVDLLE